MPLDAVTTRENWERLVQAEEALKRVIPDCDTAEACGVDVAGRRMTIEQMRNMISQMRGALFPQGEPPQ